MKFCILHFWTFYLKKKKLTNKLPLIFTKWKTHEPHIKYLMIVNLNIKIFIRNIFWVLSNIAMKRYHTCVINQEKNYTPMFDSWTVLNISKSKYIISERKSCHLFLFPKLSFISGSSKFDWLYLICVISVFIVFLVSILCL